jgi:hypothetical protein
MYMHPGSRPKRRINVVWVAGTAVPTPPLHLLEFERMSFTQLDRNRAKEVGTCNNIKHLLYYQWARDGVALRSFAPMSGIGLFAVPSGPTSNRAITPLSVMFTPPPFKSIR